MASTVTARAPAWADGVTVSGAEMRAAIGGSIYANAGIVRGLAVVQIPTPAMSVRVPVGMCAVNDGQNGFVPLELATQTDLTIGASSATLPRIDSVIAEFVDNGASSLYQFRVVAGTPNASPVQPALPDAIQPTGKTLRLYNVAVAANVTTILQANITKQAGTALLAAEGRVPTIASDGARPANPPDTTTRWRSDKGCFETAIGGTWYEYSVAGLGNAWTTYTPVWTAQTTNPVLGNGSITGRYRRTGKTVQLAIRVTTGSTTTYGSGSYRLSLPFPPTAAVEQFLQAQYFDTSLSDAYPGQCALAVAGYAALQSFAVTGTDIRTLNVTNTVPLTWANTDFLRVFGTYEIA